MKLSNVMYMLVVNMNRDVRMNIIEVFHFPQIFFLVGVLLLPLSFDRMVEEMLSCESFRCNDRNCTVLLSSILTFLSVMFLTVRPSAAARTQRTFSLACCSSSLLIPPLNYVSVILLSAGTHTFAPLDIYVNSFRPTRETAFVISWLPF